MVEYLLNTHVGTHIRVVSSLWRFMLQITADMQNMLSFSLSIAHKCMYAIILISDHRATKKKYAIIIFFYIQPARAHCVREEIVIDIFFSSTNYNL